MESNLPQPQAQVPPSPFAPPIPLQPLTLRRTKSSPRPVSPTHHPYPAAPGPAKRNMPFVSSPSRACNDQNFSAISLWVFLRLEKRASCLFLAFWCVPRSTIGLRPSMREEDSTWFAANSRCACEHFWFTTKHHSFISGNVKKKLYVTTPFYPPLGFLNPGCAIRRRRTSACTRPRTSYSTSFRTFCRSARRSIGVWWPRGRFGYVSGSSSRWFGGCWNEGVSFMVRWICDG